MQLEIMFENKSRNVHSRFLANDISVVSPSSEYDINKNEGLSGLKIDRIHAISTVNKAPRSLEGSPLHIERVVTGEAENKRAGTTARKIFSSADSTDSHISGEGRIMPWLKGKLMKMLKL
jgi:hypothetical protein